MVLRFALVVSICCALPAFAETQMTDVSCGDSGRIASMLTNALGA